MTELGDSTKAGTAQYILNQADVLRKVLEGAQKHINAHSAPSTPLFDATKPNYGDFTLSTDFATIKIQYTPNKKVIELKALKIYINSFMNRYISHENSANEIFDTLYTKLEPKWLKVVADFKPRGNVHTVIEIDSSKI